MNDDRLDKMMPDSVQILTLLTELDVIKGFSIVHRESGDYIVSAYRTEDDNTTWAVNSPISLDDGLGCLVDMVVTDLRKNT